MRLLHVYSGNLYGGIEATLSTLARVGSGAPFEQRFALCYEGRLSRELRDAGSSVVDLGPARLSSPLRWWLARARLTHAIREWAPCVVIHHAPWALALFGDLSVAAGACPVLWAHDVWTGVSWVERFAARREPVAVVANSRFTLSSLAEVWPKARLEAVACPVGFLKKPDARVDPRARAILRAVLGAGEDQVVIVQASRLERWKGHLLHLGALSRLLDLPNWVSWIAGGVQRPKETQYFKELRAEAERLGLLDRVRFLGQRADVPELLEAADIYLQPNTGPEPFGVALVEALAAGLPVVTADIGGAPEIVTADCGVRVSRPDPDAYARVLRELLTSRDRRVELGRRGPARAASVSDPVQVVERLAAFLSRACDLRG